MQLIKTKDKFNIVQKTIRKMTTEVKRKKKKKKTKKTE